MPIDVKKSALTDEERFVLASKHNIRPESVDNLVAQLQIWMFNPTLEIGDDVSVDQLIKRHRDNAQHRTAAIIWFVHAAKRRKISFFEAADVLIALNNLDLA